MSAIAFCSLACSSGCTSCSSSAKAQEARERAIAAARELIASDHSDTMALQHKILDAKAIQSEYAIAGDSIAAKAFDEAFREHIRQNDESLAIAIFK